MCFIAFIFDRAFNVEIASIRDQVSQKYAGFGRMVFWRELVNDIYKDDKPIPSHPVAKELSLAIKQVSPFHILC